MSARAAEQRLRDFQAEREDQSLHNLIRERFEADRKPARRDGVTVQQLRSYLAAFPQDATVKIETWDDQGYSEQHPPWIVRRRDDLVVITTR